MRILIPALLFLIALSSCTQTPRQEAAQAAAEKRAKPTETYDLKGEVLGMNPVNQTVLLRHEEIKGWMEAMTMEFPVKQKSDFEKFKPKQKITAKVNVQGDEFWISDIVWLP
jgi:Cu/Ag efflux protein CusF